MTTFASKNLNFHNSNQLNKSINQDCNCSGPIDFSRLNVVISGCWERAPVLFFIPIHNQYHCYPV